MAQRININADMAGYGHYKIGNDDEILKIVQSVNVACGMHGGDATVMRDVCLKAKANGVSIGAHPGFSDLWGFGRRQIRMNANDLEYLVAYQLGGAGRNGRLCRGEGDACEAAWRTEQYVRGGPRLRAGHWPRDQDGRRHAVLYRCPAPRWRRRRWRSACRWRAKPSSIASMRMMAICAHAPMPTR